jgi:4-aminobutyrate aminotransferase/(S)-3-amino-2-methylpropionate transaminase
MEQGTSPRSAEAVGWGERRARSVARGVATTHDLLIVRARGARLWDSEGREYLDGMAGLGVMNVGHGHPAVVAAIEAQARTLLHTCAHTAWNAPYIELAEALARRAPGDFAKKVLLVNTGAEAVENAIKIARAHTRRTAVLAFQQAFHGRTYMALTLTDKAHGYKEGFAPFAPDVHRAPSAYCYRCPVGREATTCAVECLDAVRRQVAVGIGEDNLAAVIVEPVQGEGGFVPLPPAFVQGLRRLCDETGAVLVADEVQCGMGRAGSLFAVEQMGVVPDIVLLAKSLAGGLPLGAVVGRAEVMDAPVPGGLGGTFAGNPVACAAALAVLDVLEREELPARARAIGERLRAAALAARPRCPGLGDVRGLGAMVGLEFVHPDGSPDPGLALAVVTAARRRGLLLMRAGVYDNVVRLLPPLVLSDEETELFAERLAGALADAGEAV